MMKKTFLELNNSLVLFISIIWNLSYVF